MKKYLNAYAPSLGELWFILLVLVCIGGSLASGAMAVVIQFIFNVDQQTFQMISVLAYPLLFVFAIPYIYRQSKNHFHLCVHKKEPLPSLPATSFGKMPILILFVLLLLVVAAYAIAIEPLTMWIPMPEFIRKIFESFTSNGWASFLSVVVMAPLLEEWLCRKVALGGLLKRGYSPAAAICWSALMFGIMHLNPWQTIPAFLVGLLLGWVYWRTRSLWAVVFMHAVNNGFAFLLTVLFPELPDDVSTLDVVGSHAYPLVLAGAVVVVGLIIWLLHKQFSPASSLFKRADHPAAA